MMHRAIRFVSTLSGTAGMTLLIMSCSLPHQRQTEGGQAGRIDQPIGSQKIVQLAFGRDASFAVCTEPACPAVTRKTLAVTWPAVPAQAPAIDTAATLDHGEVLLTAQQGTPDVAATSTALHSTPVIVHFASGSARLSASAKAVLEQAIPSARQAGRIVIAGRTDNTGSNRINQALALARAHTVRDYLRARLPVRDHALMLDAQGSCCFTASNDTPEGRRQNRRVEIVFRVPEQVTP